MRYLALADVHGNLEALEAVLEDSSGQFEATLFLGDLVDYGPNPNECVARVRSLPDIVALAGNHDLAVLGELDLEAFNSLAQASAGWTAGQLNDESRAFLQSLPTITLTLGITLAHASIRDPVWEYLDSPELGPPNFHVLETDIGFVGHTHVPRVFEETGERNSGRTSVFGARENTQLDLRKMGRAIVNPGSVGQPRDRDPRAAYGIWDVDAATFAFHRVPYDIGATQRKMIAAGLPLPLTSRLSEGR